MICIFCEVPCSDPWCPNCGREDGVMTKDAAEAYIMAPLSDTYEDEPVGDWYDGEEYGDPYC